MAAPSVVIDLGEDRRGPDEARSFPRASRPAVRRVPLLAILLLLLALGGAAPPGYRLVPLFSVPIGGMDVYAMAGGDLYVSDTQRVSAYRLPAGTREWVSGPLEHPAGAIVPVPSAGVVLIDHAGDGPTGMVALDARTGRVRWRAEQEQLVTALPGQHRVLLLGPDWLRGVDARTGRTVWQRPRLYYVVLPADLSARDGPARLAFDTVDGSTEVIDAGTGGRVARARLPAKPPIAGLESDPMPDGFPRWTQVIVGDQFLTTTRRNGVTALDAYDLGTLAHRWHATLDSWAIYVEDCGPVLCVEGAAAIAGVDSRTGALLWRTHDWRIAQPLPAGTLLVSNAAQEGPAAVVDARTLRPRLSLDLGSPVDGGAGPDRALIAWDADAQHTVFATVEAGAARPRVLGWVAGAVANTCSATTRYLACATARDGLIFLRYR